MVLTHRIIRDKIIIHQPCNIYLLLSLLNLPFTRNNILMLESFINDLKATKEVEVNGKEFTSKVKLD